LSYARKADDRLPPSRPLLKSIWASFAAALFSPN